MNADRPCRADCNNPRCDSVRCFGITLAEALKVGDVVPMPPRPKLRPAFTGPGKTSFKPGRNGRGGRK